MYLIETAAVLGEAGNVERLNIIQNGRICCRDDVPMGDAIRLRHRQHDSAGEDQSQGKPDVEDSNRHWYPISRVTLQ